MRNGFYEHLGTQILYQRFSNMRNGYYKDAYGNQRWFKNDNLHREDGPAFIWADGTQDWWVNGKRHRDDSPAFIWSNGTQEWYVNGKRHREDGPAIMYSDGTKEWFVNDKYITDEVNQWFEECNLVYETMEFEDKMALKFYIRGLAT